MRYPKKTTLPVHVGVKRRCARTAFRSKSGCCEDFHRRRGDENMGADGRTCTGAFHGEQSMLCRHASLSQPEGDDAPGSLDLAERDRTRISEGSPTFLRAGG